MRGGFGPSAHTRFRDATQGLAKARRALATTFPPAGGPVDVARRALPRLPAERRRRRVRGERPGDEVRRVRADPPPPR